MENLKHYDVGVTFGSFDLLHAGHLEFFAGCKARCDKLEVCLQTDPSIDRPWKNKPIQSILERITMVNACRYIDAIACVYDTEKDVENWLARNFVFDGQSRARFMGSEYEEGDAYENITGREVCEKQGIDLVFIPRLHLHSSTELRTRIYMAEKAKIEKLHG